MNDKERVKLVFETISKVAGFEIKPDKGFYIIEDGIKFTYYIDKVLDLYYQTPNGPYKPSEYNISPLLKGEYQLEEIKEPLLTEEEKKFLRQFNFEGLKISTLLYMYNENNMIISVIYLSNINVSLDGLKRGKRYSRKELGL